MLARILLLIGLLTMSTFAQPAIEPGVSLELAKWRAAHYSDIRYKLNLTLEKMSPVLKGTIEIRVKVGTRTLLSASPQGSDVPPIILDWRKIRGHEGKSTLANVTLNGEPVEFRLSADADRSVRVPFEELNEHLIFRDGVRIGENVIKLDFTSPILTSGSAITRYVDKEDGSEYIYSLFVPSDASTAFPVFDQPDLKARFQLNVVAPKEWEIVSNGYLKYERDCFVPLNSDQKVDCRIPEGSQDIGFSETKPISTYVFAFAAGPFEKFSSVSSAAGLPAKNVTGAGRASPPLNGVDGSIYVRRSQTEKFKPYAAEVFRLNREAIKYFEQYFDYKFPFPKYDLVLIPEFPFGGMEHAGATFLRESSIIFPQEPTRNDHISRALLMFHEASHQWFGDTVTMRWFDDLWLKEGFATFTAYKAMERIMPEANAWKVFYERVKQAAYQTDSTKGTTPIYQEIPNLSAAKSAYGAIVYNKAPAFLRQAEFYLGEDKFQTAVRAFSKKHEFGNAGWEDLLSEFSEVGWKDAMGPRLPPDGVVSKEAEDYFRNQLRKDLETWVRQPGMPLIRTTVSSFRIWEPFEKSRSMNPGVFDGRRSQTNMLGQHNLWTQRFKMLGAFANGLQKSVDVTVFYDEGWYDGRPVSFLFRDSIPEKSSTPLFVFPNSQDYGYAIFLLDEKSRDHVLKNIQNEKDPFLRSMMWGSLWDSVREGELDPREYVELVVKVLGSSPAGGRTTPSAAKKAAAATPPIQEGSPIADDESTVALLLNRVSTAMRYYIDPAGPQAPLPASAQRAETPKRPADARQAGSLRSHVEDLLIERMRNAETLGQRITFYRAFLNIASSQKAQGILKGMLVAGALKRPADAVQAGSLRSDGIPLKAKDRFDIVTRLIILGDPDGLKLLADLEKTETSDDARRWAYAARAGVPIAESKAKYWNDFVSNKDISESWIEAAFSSFNSTRHAELTRPYLERALQELPNHKRNRKIFFVNGWLGAFIGGQRSEAALAIVNKFLADNPNLDRDLRLKILENIDLIERAVKIRSRFSKP